MISESREAYVWVWLPGETAPVVAGRLEADGGRVFFNYGRSYLERLHDGRPVMSLYEPELPLRSGALPLPDGLMMPGCIRDAAPDAWGRRVILNRLTGQRGARSDTADLAELTYLLESGSDRIGALDFQHSPAEYVPRRAGAVSLTVLMESARRVEKGLPLAPMLDEALFRGSSIGGARPKALIDDGGKKYVAKFSSTSDIYRVVRLEFVAMRLAAAAGLDVAPVKLVHVAGRDVLLVERFDRVPVGDGFSRRAMVSALTLLGLDEMMARYASYEDFAEIIRRRFIEPKKTLRELFSRLVFNILCGNTDDHARNHAAFWDGKTLSLTPAYDICPQNRTGNEASQAMLIAGGNNLSQWKTCALAASSFLLSGEEARDIFNTQKAVIEDNWQVVCDEAGLGEADRKLFWGRQFLNPFSLE